jgi:hypothetical protein
MQNKAIRKRERIKKKSQFTIGEITMYVYIYYNRHELIVGQR